MSNIKYKVSVDFDGSLDRNDVQKYIKLLVDEGHDVWIVTRRYDSVDRYTEEFQIKYKILDIESEHKYLFKVADEVGIPRDHIVFMNMEDKYHLFAVNKDFIWHLDDDYLECNDINRHTKVKAICLTSGGWMNKCNKLLRDEENI